MSESAESNSRLDTIIAILIALVSVLGAVVAWRASVIADASGDADYAGLRASLFASETRALNSVNAYEHYGAFTSYSRYNGLGKLIEEELSSDNGLNEDQAYLLDRQRAEAFDLAKANQYLFSSRFVNRDGSYGIQRELGEMWADAAKENDLYPNPQYEEADRLRTKSNRMLGTLAILAIALIFFTLVETTGGRLRRFMIILGLLFMTSGTIAAIYIDFFVK
jgi:hypothetical protein